MKTTRLKNQRGFVHTVGIIALAVVIVTVSFFVYQRVQDTNQANSTANLPGATQTKVPLVIKSVAFSTTVDSAGKAIAPTTTFSTTDSKINVVATLQNPAKGMRIEFVRYRDNRFVDNGSLAIAKDGAQYAKFYFTINPGKKHPIGTYKVKLYANGVYQTSSTYSVK